jgi:hypothetical protein
MDEEAYKQVLQDILKVTTVGEVIAIANRILKEN